MKQLSLFIILLALIGCSRVQIPDYIKSDRPYSRKISGDHDKIIATVKEVLQKNGWSIQSEINPSIYERRSGGEDQTNDVLIFTEVKQHSKVLYSTYTHLNVFIRAMADGAEVEIRYEAITPGAFKRSKLRNDRLGKNLLDQIERATESN